jgi:sterol desaturase/sphingolipid hydroxylase (fatty acid hydroxylase superfamily)
VHKKHHKFNVSIGIASEFAHPLEDALANLIPTLLGSFLMGSHIVVLWTWIAVRLLETVDSHSGFHFPWSPFSCLPFQSGVLRHDFHHSANVGCYGAMTVFWDSVMGTDEAYLSHQMAVESKKAL